MIGTINTEPAEAWPAGGNLRLAPHDGSLPAARRPIYPASASGRASSRANAPVNS